MNNSLNFMFDVSVFFLTKVRLIWTNNFNYLYENFKRINRKSKEIKEN